MAPLYQEHFGLDRPPFDKNLLDSELWLPSGKQDLVEDILDALRARESVLLYGESGVGKTCVLRVLRHRINATALSVGRADRYFSQRVTSGCLARFAVT